MCRFNEIEFTCQSLPKARYVKAADGSPLLLSDLPQARNHRWTMRHKANVVAAVRGGLIRLEDMYERYNLTAEEFSSWVEAVDRFGVPGLRATHAQVYKRKAQDGCPGAAPEAD